MTHKPFCSRRNFLLSSAAAGTLAAAPAGGLRAESEVPPRNQNTVTKIKKVFLAKPVPTWPRPDIDLGAEMKMINARLDELKPGWSRPVEMVGGELLRVAGDVTRFWQTLGDADAVLAFNLTSGCGAMLDPIIDFGYPTLLFSQPYAGHDWSGIGDKQRQGKRVEVISSSSLEDLEPYLRVLDSMRRIRQTRILCLQSNTHKSNFVLGLEKQFGPEIHLLDYSELNALYQKSDTAQAAKLADDFIAAAVGMVEPTREEVIRSMRLYLAIRELLSRYSAEVITVDCLGGFNRGELPAYPCLAWSMLNDMGKVGVCEADLETTLTQTLLTYLTGLPGFVSDPVIDTRTNTVIHAHCVSATRMDGPGQSAAPYIIRSHMEDNKGVSMQVKMRVGQEITLAKISRGKMLISTGTILDNPDNPRGCRTKVTTRVADADRLLHNYTGGLHRVLVYGQHVRDVKRMGRLMGFEVADEMG